jgi:type IV pilus assembly protein PilQ
MDVSDFATPVDKVIASNQGRNSRILIQPQGDWEFSSYQTERKLVVEVRKAVVESASKTELNSKPQYKGDKLSLNFQNIEVRTVLQVIAEFTGLNIVTSDSVRQYHPAPERCAVGSGTGPDSANQGPGSAAQRQYHQHCPA